MSIRVEPTAPRAWSVPGRNVIRPEIEALRAIAVLAVVVNHLWPARLTGGFVGVDVFFVISGFLITDHLAREMSSQGTIRLGRFWLRRARRLLPAALLVLLVVAIATFAVMPTSLWPNVFGQIAASALYVENWALALTATDYFAAASDVSPVMHFWSLSVEEQFYLAWPVLLLVSALLFGRRRRTLVGVAVAVAVAGFAWSVVVAFTNPAPAYFDTFARAWQFAFGAVLALVFTGERRAELRASVPMRHAVRWTGWTLVLGSTVLMTGALPLPGAIAAVPVVGACLVIWAGSFGGPRTPATRAANRALLAVGGASYSLYLWHWPIIVLTPFVLDRPLAALDKLVILLAALGLAVATKRLVEDPIRSARYLTTGPARRSLPIFAATVVVVAVAASGMFIAEARAGAAQSSLETTAGSSCFAAAAMAPGADCGDRHVLADADVAMVAASDLQGRVDRGEICMQERDAVEVLSCSFGASADEATLEVALVGDSHAAMWIGAFNQLAEQRSWRITEYLRSSCPAALGDVRAAWYLEGAQTCQAWAERAIERIAERDDIDVVVTSSISREYVQPDPATGELGPIRPESYIDAWQRWADSGKQVIVLADTPRWNLGDVPACVQAAGTLSDPCSVPAAARDGDPMAAAVAALGDPRINLVDLNDFFCDAELCHVAIGGVVAIGDGNHMTTSFSASLAPFLGDAIDALVPGVRSDRVEARG